MVASDINILVIDTDTIRGSVLEDGLREAGYLDVTIITEMNNLVRRISFNDPAALAYDRGDKRAPKGILSKSGGLFPLLMSSARLDVVSC